MWKLQILREIEFGGSRVSESDFSAHLEVMNFDLHEFLQFIKVEILQKMAVLQFNWFHIKLK